MPLDDRQCLALWERGAARHPLDRALLLATAAEPGVAWAEQPLGARDAALIALRCEWFGPHFEARLGCPACGEMLSLSLDLREFAARGPTNAAPVVVGEARFRRPTSRDLAALVGAADAEQAARTLLERIALDGPRDWNADERDAIDAALDQADPLAHVALDVACEQCGHRWPAPLDIGASLWDELTAAASQVVDEVHTLACAYGWSEDRILAMPGTRRRLYLQRVAP